MKQPAYFGDVARDVIKGVLWALVFTLLAVRGQSVSITPGIIGGLSAYFLGVLSCGAWINRRLLSALPAPWPLVLPMGTLGALFMPAYALLYGLQQALLAFGCVLGAVAVGAFVWYVHQ